MDKSTFRILHYRAKHTHLAQELEKLGKIQGKVEQVAGPAAASCKRGE